MKSLFLRTYLGVILFALVSIVLVLKFVVYPAIELEQWEYTKDEIHDNYEVLTSRLKDQTEDKWPAIVEAAQDELSRTIKLVNIDEINNPRFKEALESNQKESFYSSRSENPWYGLFRIGKSKQVLFIEDSDPSFENVEVFEEDNSSFDEGSYFGDFTLLTTSEKLEIFAPLVIITLAQLLGVVLLVRSIRKPIDELRKNTERFGLGDFSIRADTSAPEPLNRLAVGFNSMADKVEQSMQEKEILIGAIPHELQTPLSRMRFLLELSNKKKTVDQLQDTMSDLEDNLEELETAVREVTELIRIHNSGSNEFEELILDDMLAKLKRQFESNQTMSISTDSRLNEPSFGNRKLLNRALSNLIQNALKYAISQCLIGAQSDSNETTLWVEDDGPGIPVDRRQEMLQPFSRLDSSRSSATGGLGLGLALVKTIADHHAGRVEITDSPLGGAKVSLTWPRTQQ